MKSHVFKNTKLHVHVKLNVHKFLFLVVLLLFLLSNEALAINLDEYESRINTAKERLSCFLQDEDKVAIGIESEKNEICRDSLDNVLTQIKKLLPAKMTITKESVQGRTFENFEIDNSWLSKKLDEIKKTEERERNPRILEAIYVLTAIQRSIQEVKGKEVSGLSKDEEKRKLEEILNRPEFARGEERKKESLEEFIDKILGWFSERTPKISSSEENFNFSEWLKTTFQMLFLLIVIAFMGFLIYRFAPHLKGLYALKPSRADERIILGEILSSEKTSDNLFDEAEKLAISGDLRNAIRKGYIAFLCELGDRKIIKLSKYKTNRDYLREASRNGKIYENMKFLTNYFERFWYGLKKPEKSDWESFRERYLQTVKSEKSGSFIS